MTSRPAVVALTCCALALAVAVAVLLMQVERYLDGGIAISSTSGLMVFRVDDTLVQYRPFDAGITPTLVLFTLALLVGAIFVAALTWRQPSSRILSSTAARNADAHTR
jgi:hypothetical protein